MARFAKQPRYKEMHRWSGRISALAKKMGRTHKSVKAEVEAVLARYNCCEICGTTKDLVLDHDHEHNYVRGLLCRNHNSLIGFAKEDEDVLREAIRYLMRKDKKHEAFVAGSKCA